MYTNPITNGTSQIVYTQSACAAPEKSVEIQEEETAGRVTDQDAYTPCFLNTVEKSLGIQISYGQEAWKDISPENQAAAREAISENGCWGVKQTSQRIVAFGKALVISMLDKELSDCKAGLEKGWCDETEMAKVEAMIRRAQSRMSQLSGSEENSAGIDAFALNSLM